MDPQSFHGDDEQLTGIGTLCVKLDSQVWPGWDPPPPSLRRGRLKGTDVTYVSLIENAINADITVNLRPRPATNHQSPITNHRLVITDY
ncbi:MAG: hypothetical protein WAK31_12495 [Chthoniobacterales bacterium]